jgi:hypothetical protein
MRKNKNLIGQIYNNLKDIFKFLALKFLMNLGVFDNDSKKLLKNFCNLWFLSKQSEQTFHSFLDYHMQRTRKRFDSYKNRFYSSEANIAFAFLPSAILLLLIIIVPYPITKQLLIITFAIVVFTTYLITLLMIARKPTQRKLIEVEQYLKILKDYSKKGRPIGILDFTKVLNQYKTIELPYSSSEIASFLFFLSRNKETKGIVLSHITSFIKRYCIKADGNPYENLDSLISKCNPKNADINSFSNLDKFITKLKQINLD